MKPTNHIVRGILALFACLAALSGCGVDRLAGGSGSDVGNGMVEGKVVTSDGKGAANTGLALVPREFNPATGSQDQITNVQTDLGGSFRFSEVRPGEYGMFGHQSQSGLRLMLQAPSIGSANVVLPADTLSLPGVIKVFLPDSVVAANGYVYIPGTTVISYISENTLFAVLDSVPAGKYPPIVYCVTNGTAAPRLISDSVTVAPGDTTVVAYFAWKQSRKLYLNTTASGANVSGTVAGFPVLVRLTSGNFNFAQAKPAGEDIRFAKANGAPLPYEVEQWDAATMVADIWVKVDTVYGNDSSHYIMMLWGKTAGTVANLSSNSAVFDTANGFQGVWHMNQGTGQQVGDATANRYNGTPSDTAPVSMAGEIGGAEHFDGVSSRVTMAGTAGSKLDFAEYGTYSVSAWVLADTVKISGNAQRQYIVQKGAAEYTLQLNNSGNWDFSEEQSTDMWSFTATPATARQWTQVTGVRVGTKMYLYENGELLDSTVKSSAGQIRDPNVDLSIGSHSGTQPAQYFAGGVDEVRISSVALSPDWIRLCYMNQRPDDKLVLFR